MRVRDGREADAQLRVPTKGGRAHGNTVACPGGRAVARPYGEVEGPGVGRLRRTHGSAFLRRGADARSHVQADAQLRVPTEGAGAR